ncbi:UNKNOWN [Stylonychia lemnae]|uniref:Uncharacterized protein n=1 Tax=Stylonychia lemnae TaxID=5949 RepID=A0A078ANK7_STYLE|nr:UNKNOWN [Stylonychia lemnae]|eukprot:CDW82553.1 UNKNOWN [Stylonychia lemnae]
MLKRINSQKPTLDFLKLEKDRKDQERLISNIAQHPHIFKVKGNVLQNSVSKVYNPVNYQQAFHLLEILSDKRRDDNQSKFRLPPMDITDINSHYKNDSITRIPESGVLNTIQLSGKSNKKKSYIPLVFKDDPELQLERKVIHQEMYTLNNGKDYVIELSFTQRKLIIIAARKRKHFKLEFPKKQGKRLVYDAVSSVHQFASLVRISKSETLYIDGLKDLLNSSVERKVSKRLIQSVIPSDDGKSDMYNQNQRPSPKIISSFQTPVTNLFKNERMSVKSFGDDFSQQNQIINKFADQMYDSNGYTQQEEDDTQGRLTISEDEEEQELGKPPGL